MSDKVLGCDGDFICEGCAVVVIGDPHYLPGEQIAYCEDCYTAELLEEAP